MSTQKFQLTTEQWNQLEDILSDSFLSYDVASERSNAHPIIAEKREQVRELSRILKEQYR